MVKPTIKLVKSSATPTELTAWNSRTPLPFDFAIALNGVIDLSPFTFLFRLQFNKAVHHFPQGVSRAPGVRHKFADQLRQPALALRIVRVHVDGGNKRACALVSGEDSTDLELTIR